MIFAVLLLLQAADGGQTASSAPQDTQAYKSCILQAAARMEASNADVSLIADTAVGTCHDKRDILKIHAAAWIERTQRPSAGVADETAEMIAKKFDADFRADAVAAILTQRALKK